MLETLFKYPRVVARHRTGPSVEARERSLTHCVSQGLAGATLLRHARELLVIAERIDITSGEPIGSPAIEMAADCWAREQHDRHRVQSLQGSRKLFVQTATTWLHFLGCLEDNEYKRCGTANVFGVVEPKAGRHFTTAAPNRSGAEFARMVDHVASRYPSARTIHLVMDNLNTHGRKSLVDHFGEQEGGHLWDRFSIHYTPKHGSWLDQAEIELGLFSRQCLGHRRIPDLKILRRETKAWNRQANRSER